MLVDGYWAFDTQHIMHKTRYPTPKSQLLTPVSCHLSSNSLDLSLANLICPKLTCLALIKLV